MSWMNTSTSTMTSIAKPTVRPASEATTSGPVASASSAAAAAAWLVGEEPQVSLRVCDRG